MLVSNYPHFVSKHHAPSSQRDTSANINPEYSAFFLEPLIFPFYHMASDSKVTWRQQQVMQPVRASIRSKMADVKLGAMPSEGLIWPLGATRELERNPNCREVHWSQNDSLKL